MALNLTRKPIRYQTKILTSDVVTSTTVAQLGFSNLVIGRTYRITAKCNFQSNNDDGAVTITHNGVILMRLLSGGGTAGVFINTSQGSRIFVATATTLTVETVSFVGMTLRSQATGEETMTILEELPDYEVTTGF